MTCIRCAYPLGESALNLCAVCAQRIGDRVIPSAGLAAFNERRQRAAARRKAKAAR